MGDRLPFTELENIDIDAARKRLDKAMAKRNEAERELRHAQWEYEKLIRKGQPVAYTKKMEDPYGR